jgi:LysR family transcriptional regulator, benzoate and cis,cis-muconate-responsive activator of ben and cat genes
VELRHLRYFVAVAEELSFRKAARRLSVSEAAISQQVAGLEDELDQKLFNRDSRRVELTENRSCFFTRSPAHAHQWWFGLAL